MDESIDRNWRRFLGGVAIAMAASQLGIFGRLRAGSAPASRADALAEAGTAKANEREQRQLAALGRATEWLNMSARGRRSTGKGWP